MQNFVVRYFEHFSEIIADSVQASVFMTFNISFGPEIHRYHKN